MAWEPKITVAIVIEHDCKVFLIEERTILFDQPADHLEPNESLQRAEVLSCVEDYLCGKHYPLDLLIHYG
ncbi:hypothetical protein W01_20690 [Candidatus Nitrotoga sp. AM1P]|nr:hypothetical protein W01_20690 [Candidatus Nitrotoga sp. AM1P]